MSVAQKITEETLQKAVIYCRVSSSKQTKRGDGLGSQETRCREYARMRGYDVIQVFSDDMSGGLIDRPGMKEMLSFLKKHKKTAQHVVIIDDINRFSRDVMVHWQLRSKLSAAGGKLESPSIEFGDDSDAVLIENLLASVSQHQRQKNAEQTRNRMRARVLNGYHVFQAPVGYRFERASGSGKILVRDEPVASILQEALEGFASGRFETQVEVKRFLESQPAYPKDLPNGEIRNQRIADVLTRVLYAGYVEVPHWDVSLRKGKHEGIISFETFERIQQRLKSGAKAPARKDISSDFPLRGFILCDDCQKPLTACWSKSRSGKKHPYYLCPTKGCASYRKSIRRDVLEGEFEDLICSLQPTETLFDMARAMFHDAWENELAQAGDAANTLRQGIKRIEKQIEGILDRILDSGNETVVKAYEQRVAKLEREKAIAEEKLAKASQPKHTLEEAFELALRFLSSPWNIWKKGDIALQKTVLRLAFLDPVAYSRKQGLRTAEIALPFKVLAGFKCNQCEMAHRGGFEPPTPRFVVWCSIQLSYRCLWVRRSGYPDD